MLRFPIDMMITKESSDLRLNNQLTLFYAWSSEYGSNSEFLSVVLRGNVETTSAEIPIFGKLGIQAWNSTTSVQTEFSKVMKRRLQEKLVDLYPKRSYVRPGSKMIYIFKGVVNIILNSDECGEVLAKERSKKPELLIQLSNDFEKMLEPQSPSFEDVVLVCGDVSIPAHKAVLSARSPVFSAMFKHPMKENISSKVQITDIEGFALRAMLIYMYSGKVSDLTMTSVINLLPASDKYQLPELKEVCCDFIKDNVSLLNVLRVIVWGDLYAQDLKSFGLNYISNNCANFSALESSEEWKSMLKTRPSLAMEILTYLVKSRESKRK